MTSIWLNYINTFWLLRKYITCFYTRKHVDISRMIITFWYFKNKRLQFISKSQISWIRVKFSFNIHKLVDDSFIFICKKILCYIFMFLCHILLFGSFSLNCRFICRKYGSSINSTWFQLNLNSTISLVSSGDKPILTADFDIKIVRLGQNSFEWIALWWLDYCVFYTYI